MPEWFENESYWEDSFELMFPRKRLEAGESEVGRLLRLVDLPAGTLLDIACGPGRHSVPLAKRGFKVTGVDVSALLLEKAQAAAREKQLTIEFVRADMRRFTRPDSFASAICLLSSFNFDSRKDELLALRNVYAALNSGGAFVLDIMGKEVLKKIFQPLLESTSPGGTRLVAKRRILDDWSKIESVWTIEKKGVASTYTFRHNLYSGAELRSVLQEAGFARVRLAGDFDGRTYDEGANRLIAIASK